MLVRVAARISSACVLFQPPAQLADVLVAAGNRAGHDDRFRPAAANRPDDVIRGGEDQEPAGRRRRTTSPAARRAAIRPRIS